MPFLPFAPGKSAIEEVTQDNEEQFFDETSGEEE